MGTAGIGYPSSHHLIYHMPDLQDQQYLASEQYKDSSHLNARIQLHQRFSTNPYGWFKWVFDQFTLPPEAKILEIGCGAGSLWTDNRFRLPPSWSITLSDFSPGMAREAKRNIGLSKSKFAYVVCNGMAVPYPEGTFDAIIANHVLYHIPDRQKALGEIHRTLKPCGRFFATTIGANHLLELAQIMEGFTPTKGMYYSSALNPNGFTLENGTEQLTLWFNQIEIHHYPDSLNVIEAQPLVAYIQSMIPKTDLQLDDNAVAGLKALIQRLIDQSGSIHIQKSSGMFICVKGSQADD